MRDLGLTIEAHAAIRTAPTLEQAVARLVTLKAEARRRFHKLALELHPDRTSDTNKVERFKVLAQVMDQLDRMKVEQPTPRPLPHRPIVHIVFTAGPGVGYSSNTSNTSTTSTTTGCWSPFSYPPGF